MFKIQSTRITQMLTHTACRHYSSRTHSNGHHGDTFKKVVGVVGGVCLGSFGNIGEKKHAVAFAAGYDHNEYIHYLIEEIVGHAIWHELGHVIHLGGFAAGMLGSLLSAQSLGERDEFYIPKAISKPVVTKCMNHQKGIVEDCLILENGQQIIGQDIIRFYEDLRAAQIVKDLEKRQKDSK